jgi:hypothetical protein
VQRKNIQYRKLELVNYNLLGYNNKKKPLHFHIQLYLSFKVTVNLTKLTFFKQ